MSDHRARPYSWRPLFWRISGALLITLLCSPLYAQPANDDCDGAAVIPANVPSAEDYTLTVDATDATLDPADPLMSCNGGDDGDQTVWWTHTPDAGGFVNYNTFGSETAGGGELDTVHAIYTGTCGDLVEVACRDSGLTDELNFEVTAGTTYYIKVGQFQGANDAGTVVMNVEEGSPPLEPATLVIESVRNGMSEPIRDIVAGLAPGARAGAQGENGEIKVVEVPNRYLPDGVIEKTRAEVVGSQIDNGSFRWHGPANLRQVFDGSENDDNAFTFGFIIAPPDTVGDVGKDHYVQMVNLVTEIFDKQGNTVLGPFPTSTFFAGLGGNCEVEDWGDPIVLYDEEMDRWLVSQFLAVVQDGLCIAVSTSGDPTGSYYQYEFDFDGIGFPDYPKYGFATGAVNVMVNLFDPFQGSALGAIDRSEMFAGDPATMVLFTGGEDQNLLIGWIPGDNDGPVFDNTPSNFFLGPPLLSDFLVVAEVAPDWETPEDSQLSFPAFIPVTPWDSVLCDRPRGACIDQPGSGTGEEPNDITFLEDLARRMMHRGQTRDFGQRKVAMLNHTVDVDGTGKAGIRWYELRNDRDRGWSLKKEGTFSPDGDHRWMGSIAMTAAGDTCLGYSLSSQTTYPSIAITGRKGTSNHMNIRELVAFDGNVDANVQTDTARWGDYSSMSIDPVDDTCWYTQEFAKPGSFIGQRFGWATKVIQYDVKPGQGQLRKRATPTENPLDSETGSRRGSKN